VGIFCFGGDLGHIADNHVTAYTGLYLVGGNAAAMPATNPVIIDNLFNSTNVEVDNVPAPTFRGNRVNGGGVTVNGGIEAHILANVVDSTPGAVSLLMSSNDSGEIADNRFGGACTLNTCSHWVFRGNHLGVNAPLTITNGNNGEVYTNAIDGAGGTPLVVTAHHFLQVVGNSFGPGQLMITDSNSVIVRGNRLNGSGIVIQGHKDATNTVFPITSGIVSGNQIDYFLANEPGGGSSPVGGWQWSIDVRYAVGDWQVENNQVTGIIRILPPLDSYSPTEPPYPNESIYNAQVIGNRALVLQVGYLAPGQLISPPTPVTLPLQATPAPDSIIMVIGNNISSVPNNNQRSAYGFVVNIYAKAVVNLNVSTQGTNTSNMAKGINSPNLLI
jgi:hypothetical protein